jgi:UDP-3-O-[3-hydroxymyristoyl] glucosamine N-acyltransferase
MKLKELAAQTYANIEQGNGETEISGAAGLDIAEKGEITFLANPKYTPQIQNTKASAIFLNEKEICEFYAPKTRILHIQELCVYFFPIRKLSRQFIKRR